MNLRIQAVCISKDATILSALKQMDKVKHKLLILMDGDLYFNLLSIGDIQRAIIRGEDLANNVVTILRSDTKTASPRDDIDDVKEQMRERKNEFMPIVDDEKHLVDVIFWEDLFGSRPSRIRDKMDLPVVIMAGGQGMRLRPLTNVLPKPLIPIGEQTMLEDIIDRFVECGCSRFYVSVNYKAQFIRWYFGNLKEKNYNVEFFQENRPLGTAGSLHLLKGLIDSTFFVSNCDIIVDEDYTEILRFHRENHNEITVVAALKNLDLPYGILETKEESLLASLKEKPEHVFKINTGMYVVEPQLLDEIPVNTFYHITMLMEKLLKEGRRVGVYPINEGSWVDIGNWEEYIKYLKI